MYLYCTIPIPKKLGCCVKQIRTSCKSNTFVLYVVFLCDLLHRQTAQLVGALVIGDCCERTSDHQTAADPTVDVSEQYQHQHWK